MNTDFTTHRIEGFAREGNARISVPLITEFDETLWQGGCINGVDLLGKFQHVVSLYPWERYNPGKELDSFLEVRLYDAGDVPDNEQLYFVAEWINKCRKTGPVLVHCQAGLNRSGLVTGLALVLDGMEPAEAIRLMRERRCPVVLCNKAFEQWLLKQRPYGKLEL
jgi:protein-tyrosine phosphatase